jgi:hypothetical protein
VINVPGRTDDIRRDLLLGDCILCGNGRAPVT